MRPALLLLAGDAHGSELDAALGLARSTGGVGRVLLFHPVEAEAALTAKALGFRLWPADGETDGVRWANAFRQAGELGYEGAITIGLDAAALPVARIDEVVQLLASHPVIVIPDGSGGIVLLALQRHEPTLVPPSPHVPDLDTLERRARQLRIPILVLEPQEGVMSSVDGTKGT